MYNFDANARSGSGQAGCNTCCCEHMSALPGETNKISINYAAWSVPIGGHGLSSRTRISVSECKSCNPDDPLVNPAFARTLVNSPLLGDLSAQYPDASPETRYAILDVYGPERGRVNLMEDGTFTYDPNAAFVGIDRFWFSADGHVGEFVISVDASEENPNPQPAFTPAIDVEGQPSIDGRYHSMSFALSASPAAVPGDIYRITVRQQALDCDCNKYDHMSCYDVTISKC